MDYPFYSVIPDAAGPPPKRPIGIQVTGDLTPALCILRVAKNT